MEDVDGDGDAPVGGTSDPLTFTASAILDTLPPALAAALAAGGGEGGDEFAARVWTTALVASYLEQMELHGWRTSPSSTPLAEQLTLLDGALGWLAQTVGDETHLEHLLARARAQVLRWAKLHDRRVTTSRGTHILTAEHVKMRGYGAAAQVYGELVNGHPTVSLFASELAIGFTRWMGMNVLVSAIMTMLGAPNTFRIPQASLTSPARDSGQHLVFLQQGGGVLRRGVHPARLRAPGPLSGLHRLLRRPPHPACHHLRLRLHAGQPLRLRRRLRVHRLSRGRQHPGHHPLRHHLLRGQPCLSW